VGLRGAESLGPILRALSAQTIAEDIEVVAVVPPGESAPDPEGFAAVRVVRLPELVTTGEAIAAGVHAATAPVVAYSEEHSWPRRDWAERLLEAHDGRAGAVSWTLENANPGSIASWVHLLSDFGPAVHPTETRPISALPWHHTSYRRELLAAYGDRLGGMLEAEWRVHDELARAGHPLMHSGDARTRHWNVSRYPGHVREECRGARSFGASRVEHGGWGPARRLAYVAATPLLFALRFGRVLPDVRRVSPPRAPVVVALMGAALAAAAVAEAWGYAAGTGSSRQARLLIELDRQRSLMRADWERWKREALRPTGSTGAAVTR
jgi:hypothetical protein